MPNLFSRNTLQARLATAFQSPDDLQSLLATIQLPGRLKQWLSRLMLLYGVPINYLVPDEGMLPKESIRFFYVDMNWVDAMIDGAFSIGRNSSRVNTASQNLDSAVLPAAKAQTSANLSKIRADYLGLPPAPVSLQVVSGFLLRSSVVQTCPGIGVNAYPQGGTPSDPQITLLNILRMEQLGPQSDTMICLLDGDAVEVDIHEPPEGLHYGIDSYNYDSSTSTVTAQKNIYTFTKSGSVVTMNINPTPLNISSCFRTNSPRVLMMSTLAAMIANLNNIPPADFDSAEMGFEMTEGVGMVEFLKRDS